jgi:hypothetical protein
VRHPQVAEVFDGIEDGFYLSREERCH